MPRGSRPGERRGGRQKGSQNKRGLMRVEAMKIAGIEPMQFLLNGLGFYNAQIDAEIAKGKKANGEVIKALFSAGREYARDAAPYCHSRLSPKEEKGPSLDVKRMTDDELKYLEDIYIRYGNPPPSRT